MMTGPTPDQVATRVALIRRHASKASVIGIYTPGIWLGGTELRVNGERLPVAFCTSALQVSEVLASHPEDALPLVLITNIEESQLSLDVMARLASRRLHRIDRWQMVRDLFRARQLDPRLVTHGWIADALLQKVPDGGYPPVTSGMLDADTVWTHLCQQHLGLPDGRPDALALIQWSLWAQNLHRYEALVHEWYVGLRQRVEDSAGDIGAVMLNALDAGYGDLLLPIGLVCEILFAPQGRTHLGIAQARARLEPYLAWHMLSTGGDEIETLARAYRTLASRVREQRERQNQVFANLLADWHKAPVMMEGLLPIEKALSAIVAELAAATPVLLLVIDGMNYAVFRELSDDLRGRGWIELTNRPGWPLPSLVSTIPSVTETSRASLLAGNVVRGNSASEKRSFATHGDLVSVSRSAHPPLLFHKGKLVEAGAAGLSGVVRDAVRDIDRKIIGVVLNAVDDHLAKSDQLRFSWTISQFHHLDALLYEARLANRAVIITSDHGHVLEDGTQHLTGSEEARWRPFSDTLAEQEVVFEGQRIEQATGLRRLIVPWSETVRYGQRKQGYHGGATPQEVLVPMGVFATLDRAIVGWEALPDCLPRWWNPIEGPPTEARSVSDRTTRGSKEGSGGQGSLFGGVQMDKEEEPSADWIVRLLSSSVFTAQWRIAGRRAPSEQHVEAFLKALDQYRYRIPRRALAEALGQPDVHIPRVLVALQRLLNVDGYQIVTVDDDPGIIKLNVQLLKKQFQIEDSQ